MMYTKYDNSGSNPTGTQVYWQVFLLGSSNTVSRREVLELSMKSIVKELLVP